MEIMPHPFYYHSGGRKFHIRPIMPSDKEFVLSGFDQLSESSRYLRFFASQQRLSDYLLKYFTEVDGINHVSWGILDVTDEPNAGVGIGRFIRLKDEPEIAEAAFTITDPYQRKGLGSVLFSVLNIAAAHVGIKIFRYYVLESNHFVLESLSHMNSIRRSYEDGAVIIDIAVHGSHTSIPALPALKNITATMKQVESLIL